MVRPHWRRFVVYSNRPNAGSADYTDVSSLLSLGRALLLSLDPRSSVHQRLDHDLATVASACLKGPEGAQAASAICKLLAEAFGSHILSFHELHIFIKAVFRVQPIAALSALLQSPPDHGTAYPTILSMFEDFSELHRNPIGEVEDDIVLEWCARDPARNFAAAATSVSYSRTGPEGGGLIWTDLAQTMLEQAPEPRNVLASFVARFQPHSWSGSRAAIIEANTALLVSVESSTHDDLAMLARQERQRLLEECRSERRWESEMSRRDDERFE